MFSFFYKKNEKKKKNKFPLHSSVALEYTARGLS